MDRFNKQSLCDSSDHELDLMPGERFDDTGFGGIGVIQKKDFGYGVDSVLLASFAAGETGGAGIRGVRGLSAGKFAKASTISSSNPSELRLADLGTGNGIIAFIASHKMPQSHITGVEKNADAYDRAVRACAANGLENRVTFIHSDVLSIESDVDLCGAFDAVLSNPPYFRRAVSSDGTVPGGTGSVDSDRYISRHETTADIWDFARVASLMLVRGGDFCVVHRPDRLVDIFDAMRKADIEPKEMQLVVPAPGKKANMVLIRGVKGARPELKLLPEIAVHNLEGGYTNEIMRFYERV